MTVRLLDQMDVWGSTLDEMMQGVKAAEAKGWFRIGTPFPMYLPTEKEFGMIHKMYRFNSKE